MTHASLVGFLTCCYLVSPGGALPHGWTDVVPVEELVRQAQLREKEGAWLAASELYAELVKREPAKAQAWQQKQQTARKQDRVSRRYYSPHVRQQLVTLPLNAALGLYEEILTKLQHHAVTELTTDQFFQYGLGNFELALQNPAYRAVLFPGGIQEAILKDYLIVLRQQYRSFPIPDRKQAVKDVKTLALNLEQDLGANPTAVVLEFTYASAEAVDDYTEFLPPELLVLMQRAERNDVASVGLGFFVLQGQLWVSTVQADSPAAQAGLATNDLIHSIDGIPTQAMTLEEAEWRLLGIDGTNVVLEVSSHVNEQPRRVKMARQKMPSRSVTGKMIDSRAGVGLIQIAWFQDTTPDEFDQVYAKLQAEGVKALVLDLRGNPGGQFHAALQTADRFIPDGILAATRGRSPGASAVYRAEYPQNISLPLVVLVDPETASAAEVLASALRDHRRGVLIGQKTFGKGCMQMVFPLKNSMGALRITTATWHSPADTNVNGKGLTPEVVVEETTEVANDTGPPLDLPQRQLIIAVQHVRRLLEAPM